MKGWRPSAPFLLLLPAIVVLAAVVIVPLLLSLYSSFTPFRLTKPETLWVFIGLRNYIKLLGDAEFWWAFGRTVLLLTIMSGWSTMRCRRWGSAIPPFPG
jgi:multiple sugar transport system permease protein